MRSIFAIGLGLLVSSWILSNSAVAGPACTGNYLLEKTFSSGSKWQLCWEHRQREGIVYHDLFYTPPSGSEKRILNQANMAQIHVPYDDNGARYHDVSDYGLGNNYLNDLQSGDCPAGELRGENNKNMICMQTRERNHAHASHIGSVNKHKIGQYFEFFSVSHVGAYNYIPTWRLYDDGSIEVIMGATGSLQRFRTGSQYQSNGWLLNSSDRFGVSHLHNYYWRLDFDLGSNANDDIVEEIEFINQTGNLSRLKSITSFTTEVARSVAPERYRSWRIRDGANTNASGHAISYQIEPILTGHRDQGPSYEPWTHNDFYVTVNKNCEKYASHNPEVNGCTDNLSAFVNGQNLSGADIVVWYGLSFHHIPRDEDEPKMHAHWNSFKIIPRNVTVKNPLADISNTGNTPPILANPGNQSNNIGETISLSLSASDVDGNNLTYTANGLPDGLNITGNGVISGIPTTAGEYNVTMTVSDGEATDQKGITWNINSIVSEGCTTYISTDVPVTITSSGTITVTSNLNVSQSGIINDVNVLNLKGLHTYMSDLDFKLTSPVGSTVQIIDNSCGSKNDFDLNLDDATTDSWPCPPIDSGTYKPSSSLTKFNGEQRKGTWVLTIHDRYNQDGGSLNQWALEICTVSTAPTNQPPILISPGTQSNTVDDLISIALIANDPDGDALTFNANNLPPGLQINNSGIISGTLQPNSAGPHVVMVSVDDGQGHTESVSFGWQVDALNQAPILSNPGDQSNLAGDIVLLAITASDPEGDTLTFSSSSLPAALQLNSTSGIISGMLESASIGSHSVTVSVNDGRGHIESVNFIWIIGDTSNQAPVLIAPANQTHTINNIISLIISATDINNDNLTYSATGLPSGLNINAQTGIISGTVNTAGAFNVNLTVTDGQANDSGTFVWTINDEVIPPIIDNELQNGIAITDLSADEENETMYIVNPEAGQNLQITISGGSGDADIYVRYGSEPTTSLYECRPYLGGNDETCTINSTQAGTYYVMIRAYHDYSGISLKASFEDSPLTPLENELLNGGSITNLTASRGDTSLYVVNPEVGRNLQITISGGTGDADVYVRYGSEPTTSEYDCRPYQNGNEETCTINSTQEGTYFVMIRAYSSYSGLNLQTNF